MTDVNATGIEVEVIDLANRGRFGNSMGHPAWTLPMGGGIIREADLVVEVKPKVDMATDRWRDYDETLKLATRVEQDGGYVWCGDEIHVGDEIVVGRDALRLLTELARRANERAKGHDEAYAQGYASGLREVKDKLMTAVEEALR